MSESNVTITYDSASGSYTVTTVPSATDPARTQSWTPTDLNTAKSTSPLDVFSKTIPGGSSLGGDRYDDLTLTRPGTSGLLLYAYVGGGTWRRLDGRSNPNNGFITTYDSFVFGFPTVMAAVPRSGTGTYLLDIYGNLVGQTQATLTGFADLVVNFATGDLTISGEGEVFRTGANRGYIDGAYYSVNGNGVLASDKNLISGDITFNVTGGTITDERRGVFTGKFNGQFFGPNAEEVGASFVAPGGFNGSLLTGFFLGKPKDVSSATLQQLTSIRKVLGIGSSLNWTESSAGEISGVSGNSGFGINPFVNPTGDAYQVRSVPFVPGDRVAAETDARITTFRLTDIDGRVYTLRAYRPGPTNDQLVLSYVSFLDWQRFTPGTDNAGPAYVGNTIVYGLRTDPTAIPRSGTGTYTGVIYGRGAANGAGLYYTMSGTANLTANFGNDQLTGTLTPTLTNTRTGNTFAIGNLNLSTGIIARTGPVDTGSAALIQGTISGAGNGKYTAAFYGPAAEELGVVFTANGIANPEATSSTITISGAAVAKKN